ncbi:MAG: hypothetical protein HOO86_11800, partial [Bacteroidales bacterium]|nr:hypothetical protein [Bacteroidales bacterium]
MATRRRTSASTGKSKKSGMARTFILIAETVIVLAAVALIITYFYIKSDRKTAPEISEINVKTPILKQVKP